MGKIFGQELIRMTQKRKNYAQKKSIRISMKVMDVKTKELNEKATKAENE